jgi:hypothetical protein
MTNYSVTELNTLTGMTNKHKIEKKYLWQVMKYFSESNAYMKIDIIDTSANNNLKKCATKLWKSHDNEKNQWFIYFIK